MSFLNYTFQGEDACDHYSGFCDCITEGGDRCVYGSSTKIKEMETKV